MVKSQSGNLFLRCAVQHKTFPGGGDAIDQSTTIGARDQVLLRIEGQYPDMGFIALEEDGMIPFWSHAEDFSVIAGRYIKISGFVQGKIPNVFRSWLEVHGRAPRRIHGGFRVIFITCARVSPLRVGTGRLIFRRLRLAVAFMFEFVDLAIGSSGGKD